MALLRTRSYVQLLVLAGLIGIPVSAVAYGYLKLVGVLQNWLFTTLPKELGFAGTPVWWPLAPAGGGRGAGGGDHHLPPGDRGPQAGRGVQGRRVRPRPSSCRASFWPRWPR